METQSPALYHPPEPLLVKKERRTLTLPNPAPKKDYITDSDNQRYLKEKLLGKVCI